MKDLTFKQLREANLKRLPLFKNSKGERAHSEPDGSDWDALMWFTALMGEVGESAEQIDPGDDDYPTFATLAKHLGLICNLYKKVRRGDLTEEEVNHEILDRLAIIRSLTHNHSGPINGWTDMEPWRDPPTSRRTLDKQKISSELADVQIYLDLLANRLGIDLEAAVIEKFNRVSERIGVEVFLGDHNSLTSSRRIASASSSTTQSRSNFAPKNS